MPFTERAYRGRYSGHFSQGVKWLLMANFGVYIVQFLLAWSSLGEIFTPFYLRPIDVAGHFWVWQLVTYMFFHDVHSFFHILFNMLTLWMFGKDLEEAWGTTQFLKYYFLCGIGAGVFVVAGNLLFGNPYSSTIGASGAIFGLMLAFAMQWPDREILFSFLFPVKAKYFVMILGGIQVLSSWASMGGPVSYIAHLGGMGVGYFYLRSRRGRRRPTLVGRTKTSFWGTMMGQYNEWKLQRARRKFQVYLRKQGDAPPKDRDRWVQ